MKPEKVYQELKDLAEKLGLGVEEHNFRNAGVRVISGTCVVHGKQLVIIDKHKPLVRKIRVLASALAKFPHDTVYMVPAVREIISKYAEDQ
jgi:hypothetical protein